MSRIVLADDGIAFDGKTFEAEPLGGVESAVVCLAEALARRGHDVTVCNRCAAPLDHNGVQWRPIHDGGAYRGVPAEADLYIANRGDRLIPLVAKARRAVFWIHNPAGYLLKWRYLSKLWRRRPAIVFIGAYHAATYPRWAPDGGRVVIPYGIPDAFATAATAEGIPGPRAVFTSNPLRSLDWLLDIWAASIYPHVPGAELHIFAGASVYGSAGDAKVTQMDAVLNKARGMQEQGVAVRGPVPKDRLIEELRAARVMLYRGDVNETFCLALGEAQAMGVPAVVQDIGSMAERVIDGVTGYVAKNDEAFSKAAMNLLSDDGLWRTQHESALARQRRWRWEDAATAFERLLP
ncbi:MAG: glycosyltransferase [Rhodospirillales bacterium]